MEDLIGWRAVVLVDGTPDEQRTGVIVDQDGDTVSIIYDEPIVMNGSRWYGSRCMISDIKLMSQRRITIAFCQNPEARRNTLVEYSNMETFAENNGFRVLAKSDMLGTKRTVMISRKPVSGTVTHELTNEMYNSRWAVLEFEREVYDESCESPIKIFVCPIDAFVILN
jgi:hypothetical protein